MRRLLATIGCFVLAALVLPWAALGCTMDACPMAAPGGACAIEVPMPCCQSVAQAPPLPAATTALVVAFVTGDAVAALVTPAPAPVAVAACAPRPVERHGGGRQALLSIFRI